MKSIAQIAEELGINKYSLKRTINRHNIEPDGLGLNSTKLFDIEKELLIKSLYSGIEYDKYGKLLPKCLSDTMDNLSIDTIDTSDTNMDSIDNIDNLVIDSNNNHKVDTIDNINIEELLMELKNIKQDNITLSNNIEYLKEQNSKLLEQSSSLLEQNTNLVTILRELQQTSARLSKIFKRITLILFKH